MEDELFEEKELTTVKYLFSINKFEEAEKHILNILKVNPTRPEALYGMGVVQGTRQNYEKARSFAQQAMINGHDEAVCHYFMGLTYDEEEKYPEAEQEYLEGLRHDPEDVDLHAEYASLMLRTGFREKGLALLDKAIEMDPLNGNVYEVLIQHGMASADQEKQRNAITSLMESGQSEVLKLMYLGNHHVYRKEYKEAKEYFVQAFLMNPTNKELREVVEVYDEFTHPLFWPTRLFEKLGGPAIVWLGFILITGVLVYFDLDNILVAFVLIYFTLALYTWVAPLFYKWFVKGKDKWIN